MKKIANENLKFISGGISDKDKDALVDMASSVGSVVGGTFGGSVGGVFGGALGSEIGKRGMEAAAKDMIENPERWEHP